MIRLNQFWQYLIEREAIRIRRLLGFPREAWTLDPIMTLARFTNVKRDHDRVSTLLMREMYEPNAARERAGEVVLNAAIFRYLGTIESARLMGWTRSWAEGREKLRLLGEAGQLKFTSAYVVPNCGSREPKHVVVRRILDGVAEVAQEVASAKRWQDAVALLASKYGVGQFMGKEVYLDLVMALGQKPEDWETWTPMGPGGTRGACWVAGISQRDVTMEEALLVTRIVYQSRETYWPEKFLLWSLDGSSIHHPNETELDLTDIQFAFCEFDKYVRIRELGHVPKRRFSPIVDSVTSRSRETAEGLDSLLVT